MRESAIERPLYVRCVDRMVFRVDRKTLDALNCGCYDAYCYSDPRSDVDYMDHSEWCIQRNKMRKERYA